MQVQIDDNYALKDPTWAAVKLTGFSMTLLAQRILEKQKPKRDILDFSTSTLKKYAKAHAGILFFHRMDLPCLGKVVNPTKTEEPFFFVWEYTCGPLNKDKLNLTTYLMSFEAIKALLDRRFGKTRPKMRSYDGFASSGSAKTTRLLFLPGTVDPPNRKAEQPKESVPGLKEILPFSDPYMHNPLKMHEPVFMLDDVDKLKTTEKTKLCMLPSFLTFAPHYATEAWKRLNFRNNVAQMIKDDESSRAAELGMNAMALKNLGEMVFSDRRVKREDVERYFTTETDINLASLSDSKSFLFRVGLSELVPHGNTPGGERFDEVYARPLTLWNYELVRGADWPNTVEQKLVHQGGMSPVRALCLEDSGEAISAFDGTLCYSENTHNVVALQEDLFKLTGVVYGLEAEFVPHLPLIEQRAEQTWKNIASSSSLFEVTFNVEEVN